jgi:hypothetical protein
MASYLNPWHHPDKTEYGPRMYHCDVRAVSYGCYEIFHRLPTVWDVVRDGVCFTQRAGLDGAKRWIDSL